MRIAPKFFSSPITMKSVIPENGKFDAYAGMTIEEVIESDEVDTGDFLIKMLRYRDYQVCKNPKVGNNGKPYGFSGFDKELNVTLDVFSYANPEFAKSLIYPHCYTKGEIKIALMEMQQEEKIRKSKQQRVEQERLLANQRREQAYAGRWGSW